MPHPQSLAVSALLTGLVALGPLSTDLYLPSLPALGQALDAPVPTVQLTLSVFLAGFAVSQLVYGPLSDRFGRRPVLVAGVALYLGASAICALAPSIDLLIAGRFLQAVGACAGPVIARAVVRDVYGRERAAKMLAYMAMAMALAPAVGPILGGYLTMWSGWRANFWALTAIACILLAGLVRGLRETNRHLDPTATRPDRLVRNYAMLLGDRTYIGYVAVVACSYSGIFSFISGSSFVFIDGMGLSPELYGLCFAAIVCGYMAGTFASGRLTMRLGIDRMVLAGVITSAAGGLAMLACALAGWLTVPAVVGPFFVFMVGAGLTLPNAMAGAVGPYPLMAGLASALLGFCQMTLAAGIGIGVGHLTDGTALPMAGAVLAVSLAAAAARLGLIRTRA